MTRSHQHGQPTSQQRDRLAIVGLVALLGVGLGIMLALALGVLSLLFPEFGQGLVEGLQHGA